MHLKTKKRSFNRINFWNNHFTKWKESSLTQAEYCRQNKLDEQLFSKWKIKINKNDNPAFVEIKKEITSKKELSASNIELEIFNKITIKLKPDFCPATLLKLLNVFGIQL